MYGLATCFGLLAMGLGDFSICIWRICLIFNIDIGFHGIVTSEII